LRLAEHAALRNWGSCVAPSSSLGLREHGEVPRPLSAGETQQIRRPGYIRTPVTFSCSAKRKVTKEKAAPVSRALRVPCAACLTSAAVELVPLKRKRFSRTQTVLADIPEVKRAARRDTGAPTAYRCTSCCARPLSGQKPELLPDRQSSHSTLRSTDWRYHSRIPARIPTVLRTRS